MVDTNAPETAPLGGGHRTITKHRSNVNKQAEQIRLCLSLAKDYFDAAQGVSLGTRPVLMYYATMNMALAEILFKQSGESSLDRARSEHRHHGLTTTVGEFKPSDTIGKSGNKLRAIPMTRHTTNQRFGTFELWHKSARQHPTYGLVDNKVNRTLDYRTLTIPDDFRMPTVPNNGITLLECLRKLPSMSSSLASYGITSDLVRGESKIEIRDDDQTTTIIIHPTQPAHLLRCLGRYKFPPAMIPAVDVNETGGGAIITINRDHTASYQSILPDCMNTEKGENFFQTSELPLNEFGYFYAALFIAGTYARYHPDKWINDIEQSSDLCLLIEELTQDAVRRVPLLILSELQRSVIVFPSK